MSLSLPHGGKLINRKNYDYKPNLLDFVIHISRQELSDLELIANGQLLILFSIHFPIGK